MSLPTSLCNGYSRRAGRYTFISVFTATKTSALRHQKGDSVSNSSLCNSVLGLSISDEAAKAASQPRRAYAPTKSRQERILHRSPLSRERRTRETGSTHACNQCSCTFARARDLKRHYRLHTGEKPYQCLGCSEGFIRVDARKRHWTCNPECLALHQNSSSSSSC